MRRSLTHAKFAARAPPPWSGPADAAQIAEILRFAAAEKLAIIPTGGCTKLGIGSPPSRYDIALDLSRLNRVLAYDPKDLTLGVEPGLRIEDLLGALGEQKQFLPLAVPFSDRATVGGIVAANSSSPLRHAYGAVRDFCLGMEFVTGEGAQAKSGGRVVKNVTGYDLHKLLIGSLGTLAVITRVNFRTFPMPQAQGTFMASFPAAKAAFEFLPRDCPLRSHAANGGSRRSRARGNLFFREKPPRESCRSSGPWSFPPRAIPLWWNAMPANSAIWAWPPEPRSSCRWTRPDAHASVLARIREFPRLALEAVPDAVIFRISALPANMPSLMAKLSAIAKHNYVEVATLTRASGIVYAVFVPVGQRPVSVVCLTTTIPEVFRVCAQTELQASAMLEWCPAEMKTSADVVWGPPRPDFELMRRVKNSFDPQNVMAPGRFAGGI